VVCDVARPPDISAAEAAIRDDVLVVESGEVQLPHLPDERVDMGMVSESVITSTPIPSSSCTVRGSGYWAAAWRRICVLG
jgi:hypothetical protein